MDRIMRVGLFCFIVFSLPLISAAGDEFEWSEISDEELMMPSIPEDPEANAIILFHLGEMKITPNYGLEMKVHKRIKILTMFLLSWHISLNMTSP